MGKYYTEDVTRETYITRSRTNAREYAGPPERLHILLEDALRHVDCIPPDARRAFAELAEWYLRARNAGGVVLGIKISHAIDALKRNRILYENTLKKYRK